MIKQQNSRDAIGSPCSAWPVTGNMVAEQVG
jgi:hypothetical protein